MLSLKHIFDASTSTVNLQNFFSQETHLSVLTAESYRCSRNCRAIPHFLANSPSPSLSTVLQKPPLILVFIHVTHILTSNSTKMCFTSIFNGTLHHFKLIHNRAQQVTRVQWLHLILRTKVILLHLHIKI